MVYPHLKSWFFQHWSQIILTAVGAAAGLFLLVWLATLLPMGLWVLVVLLVGVGLTGWIEWRRFHHTQQLNTLRYQAETSGALGQEITASPDLEDLLLAIAILLQSRFQYQAVTLCLLAEDRTVSRLAQVGEKQLPLAVGDALNPEDALGTAVFEKQLVLVNRAEAKNPSNLLPGMESELVLPLVVAYKLLGFIDIQGHSPHLFDSDHVLMLQSLAAQTAVAVRNATLYQREVSRRHLAETLYDIGLALSGTLNREEVLGLILDQLAAIVPYDRAALLLDNNHELEIVAARGFPADSQPLQIRISLERAEDDIYLIIHRSHKPLVVPDVSKLPNWIHVPGLPIAQSWLGVPLLHETQVIGMLSLVRETADAYDEEDAIQATTFAIQAAIALHNAELYNQIDQYNRQLAYEVEQRTQAVLRLARLDQAKSNFINIAAHELRTPLTTIKGYSQMLLQELSSAQNGTNREMVSAILGGANRLHEIVNNMLNVAKIDNETLDLFFQSLSLPHLLDRIAREQQGAVKERRLTLTVSPMADVPEVEGDVEALHMAFSHLVVNAIKYTPDGGEITISHRMGTDGETAVSTVEIMISDTGIGIPAEAQDLIFAKFYQTGKVALHSSGKTKFKGGGPGLGLAIVRGIVEAHNGRVWATSAGYDEETLPGSQFHVVLPLKQS